MVLADTIFVMSISLSCGHFFCTGCLHRWTSNQFLMFLTKNHRPDYYPVNARSLLRSGLPLDDSTLTKIASWRAARPYALKDLVYTCPVCRHPYSKVPTRPGLAWRPVDRAIKKLRMASDMAAEDPSISNTVPPNYWRGLFTRYASVFPT